MEEQVKRLSLEPSKTLNTRQNNDLWAQAIERLSSEERQDINFSYDKLTVLSDLRGDVDVARQKCEDSRLHFKRRSGEKVILRDLLGKVIKWVNLFKQVGDTAVQYDPGHAALPWALVRFVLQVCQSDHATRHQYI
jgi:hypothetical protein